MKKLCLLFLATGMFIACKKYAPNVAANNVLINGADKIRLNGAGSADSVFKAQTFAGVPGSSGSTNGTGRLSAKFFAPEGIAFDSNGNMIVADRDNSVIRKITPAGVVSVLAGVVGSAGLVDNANPLLAKFNSPIRVAIDASDNIFVADRDNARIRKIDASTGAVTTYAGSTAGSGTTQFNWPLDIAIASSGIMYVADAHNNRIQKISTAGVVSLLAGSTTNVSGNTNGTGSAARFNNPSGVAIDNAGNIIVADRDNNRLRQVTSAGVTTYKAGTGHAGVVDGPALNGRMYQPFGVKVASDGTIYVTEIGSNTVRLLNAHGLLTIGGNNTAGFANNDFSKFSTPTSVAIDGSGNLYVADIGNQVIRKMVPTSRVLYSTLRWAADSLSTGMVRYHFTGTYLLRDSLQSDSENVNVLDINLNSFKLVFRSETYANATTVSNMASHVTGAIAAINGTFGDRYPDHDSTGAHVSFLKNRSTLYWQVGIPSSNIQWWKSDGGYYYQDAADTHGMELGDANRYTLDAYANILSGGPLLINNYSRGTTTFNHSTTLAQRLAGDHQGIDNNQGLANPRTIIAITSSNHLLLVTVDGRQPGTAEGFNSDEMMQFMQTYFNPSYALNLDGGGSTTMWIASKGGVVNVPSNAGGVERATLTNAIVVVPH